MTKRQNRTVQDLIIQKLDNLELKVDTFVSEKFPALLVEVSRLNTINKEEIKLQSALEAKAMKIWGGIAGTLTITIAVIGLIVSFLRH